MLTSVGQKPPFPFVLDSVTRREENQAYWLPSCLIIKPSVSVRQLHCPEVRCLKHAAGSVA